jgi:hypothetical protein
MRCCAYSSAAVFVIPTTPCLLATYADGSADRQSERPADAAVVEVFMEILGREITVGCSIVYAANGGHRGIQALQTILG